MNNKIIKIKTNPNKTKQKKRTYAKVAKKKKHLLNFGFYISFLGF
jgi:hypothetical protein